MYNTSDYKENFDVVNAKAPWIPAFTSDSRWGFIPDRSQGDNSVVSVVSNRYSKERGTFWTQIPVPMHGSNNVVVNRASDGVEYAYVYSEGGIAVIDTTHTDTHPPFDVKAHLDVRVIYDASPAFSKDGSILYAPLDTSVMAIKTDIHGFKTLKETKKFNASPVSLEVVEVD